MRELGGGISLGEESWDQHVSHSGFLSYPELLDSSICLLLTGTSHSVELNRKETSKHIDKSDSTQHQEEREKYKCHNREGQVWRTP